MSNSPFADPATFVQSVLTFEVPSGTGGIDERGNPVSQTQEITVQAWLRTGGQADPALDAEEPGEGVAITCEGYLTNPTTLPPELLAGARGHGTVNGRTGEVVLQPTLVANLAPVREALGDKIRVKFRSSVRWGEAV